MRGIARIIILLGAVFAVIFSSQSAQATATLSLFDGTHSKLIADQDAYDLNSNPGVVTYIGALGCFDINITTGTTYPDIGSLSYPMLNLKDVSIEGTDSGTLTIKFSEIGFGPTGSADFITQAWGGTTESVTFNSYFDSGNNLFGQGTLVGTLGTYSNTLFNGTTTSSGNPSNPYSLTNVATITYNAPSATAFNMNLSVVPEPVSSTLFIIGGAVLGFRSFRKMKKA